MKRARYIANQVEMGSIMVLCLGAVALMALNEADSLWIRRTWMVVLAGALWANLIAQVVRRSIDRRFNFP